MWQDKTTLLATFDKNNNLKQRFEYGLSHTPIAFTQAGKRYYILSDQIGSPRFITDASGTVLNRIERDSYGNVVSESNEAFQIPFGFAGGLYDHDTGLSRFGYRDYDAETGRWTARDPIGFAGGDTNLYGYVANNPIQFSDPTGLIRWKQAGLALLGSLSNIGGMVVGSILLAAPEPTMLTKALGSTILAKSTAGFGLNIHNLTTALTQESDAFDAPASVARLGAKIIAPCSSDAQRYADIIDLSLDFASGRVPIAFVSKGGSALTHGVNLSTVNKINHGGGVGQPTLNTALDTLQFNATAGIGYDTYTGLDQ